MILPLKQTGFQQLNLGDKLYLGDLNSSFNLDLKELGTLKASPRLILNISEADDAQLDAPPCAFRFLKAAGTPVKYVWTIAGAYAWYSSGGPETAFVQDDTGGTPTHCSSDASDLEVAWGIMFVTEQSDEIYKIGSAGTWSNISNALTSTSGIHAMTYFRAQNKIYIVDDNSAGVGSLDDDAATYTDPAASTQYTLNDLCAGDGINTGSTISWINSNSSRVWIGEISRDAAQCFVYAWDGSTGGGGTYGPNEAYTLDSSGSLACVIKDDIPYIFDVRGRLLKFNGGTFVEIARLPFENDPPITSDALPTARLCHYNGMDLVDGKITILVNTKLNNTNGTIKSNVPSGAWQYTEEQGLVHIASPGLSKSGDSITDYGSQKLAAVGALKEIDFQSTLTAGSVNGRYMMGCDYYTNATTSKSAIFYNDEKNTLQKACSFITQKIPSSQITDTWQKIYAILGRKFLSSTDKIVISARTEENDPVEATITYVNTTSFTVLASAFTTNPVAGESVEILTGTGAGRSMHITAVSGTTTLTITVDETITGATTQTAKARFHNFKKLGSYSAQTDNFFKLPIDSSLVGSTPWIQLKLWILWTGDNKINSLIVSSKPNETIE